MAKLTRRGFIAAALAAGTFRNLPQIAVKTGRGAADFDIGV